MDGFVGGLRRRQRPRPSKMTLVLLGPLGLVGVVVAFLVRRSEILALASSRFAGMWRVSLRSAHLLGAVILIAYLGVVGLNSLWFGYDFWEEPAPTSTADGIALVSLALLFGVASVVGAGLYAHLCFVALGTDGRIRDGLLWALRWLPLSLVAVVAAVAALPLGLPSVLVVVLLAPSPLYLRATREDRLGVPYWRFVRTNLYDLLAVGAAVALMAIPVDLAVAGSLRLTDSLDGTAEILAVSVCAYLIWMLLIAITGWTASAVAALWERATPATATV